MRAITWAVAAALLVSACAPSTPPHAPPAPSTPALPPGFPDTSGYTEGAKSTYYSTGLQYGGYNFLTPGGQQCSSNGYPGDEYTTVQCWGPRPDRGPGTWAVNVRQTAPASIRRLPSGNGDAGPAVLLPPDHVLKSDAAQMLCAVDDAGAVACRVGEHGFVLTATETTLF